MCKRRGAERLGLFDRPLSHSHALGARSRTPKDSILRCTSRDRPGNLEGCGLSARRRKEREDALSRRINSPRGSPSGLHRMFSLKKLSSPRNENPLLTWRGPAAPSAPSSIALFMASRRSWWRNMTPEHTHVSRRRIFMYIRIALTDLPSMKTRSFDERACSIGTSSAAVRATGFSASTCLPAAAALGTHSACSAVGSGT